jgi:PKD repeat protein
MRRSYLIILIIMVFTVIALVGTTLGPVWGLDGNFKTITINRNIQIAVDKVGQKRELIIPQEPLDFATTLTWDVNITKKISSEKIPAAFTIEEVGTAKQIERKLATSSGNLSIPKGKQYKITIDAGEYVILIKTGATVKASLTFAEAQVKYSLGDKPFLVDFEITGPAGLNDWKWLWNNDDSSSGKTVTHQFAGDGKTLIMVEGNGKTSSGATSAQYRFEFDVPPLVTLTPKVDPLKGPVELAVTGSVNAVVNYGQKATYTWNFGNSVEITGPEAHNTYVKPGRYQVVLTAGVNDYKTERTWLVEVSPETVLPNVMVTPALGPVPLKVTGTVNPKISGGPAQLEYRWEMAGETTTGNKFEHTFSEPGDYRLLVTIVDKLHPDVVIPEEIVLIKALPPQIGLKATASSVQGTIPLAVNFDSGKTITGNPVELFYRWEFGDGEVSMLEKPTHVFKRPGEYQVRLVVSDGLHSGNLADTVLTVTALPPQMKVTVKPSVTQGLAPLPVNFGATVSVTGSPCDPQYRWDFNDGTFSLEQNPVHHFKQPGLYQVTLEVKDRYHPTVIEKVTTEIDVKIPKLRLNASVSPTAGSAPLTVKCQATASLEGTGKPVFKYIWDFGTGKTFEGPEQSYTYEKAGTYTIQVSVANEELGITERKTLKVTVK